MKFRKRPLTLAKRKLKESRRAGLDALNGLIKLIELLQEDRKQSVGIAIRAISMLEPRHRENGMLENSGSQICHPSQMAEPEWLESHGVSKN
jgi:hypothetical protein